LFAAEVIKADGARLRRLVIFGANWQDVVVGLDQDKRRQIVLSVAWSWAFDTPFKWTKQVASHFGGTRQGMAISWPGHINDVGGIRAQFHHMIDVVPTILDAAGLNAPATVNGIAQKPIEGVSMMYTFDKANANAPSKRDTQYFEMVGNRAIYHDGWTKTSAFPSAMRPAFWTGTTQSPPKSPYPRAALKA
jgi:arylsulfatase A-like enzyme